MRKKILVIDDSALERELMIEILRVQGVKNEFLQVKNAHAAIDILMRRCDDIGLILLDWEMAGFSGIEFLKSLSGIKTAPNIPIVMVTAVSGEKSEQEARTANPCLAGYIVKPYEPEFLLKVITPYIKSPEAI